MIPRYTLKDVIFTGLADSRDRNDVTYDPATKAKIITILPRPNVLHLPPRLRFTKSPPPPQPRLDLTDRPTSFASATSRVPDPVVVIQVSPVRTSTKRKLILAITHLTRPKGKTIR